jgi:AI-2 transport protein TqsA
VSNRRENWELERRLQTACLLIITAILCAVAAYWMRAVLIPFVLSFFLFQLLAPIVRFLNRKARLPHPLAVTVTLLLVGTVIFYTSSVITGSVGQLLKGSDAYTAKLAEILDNLYEHYPPLEARFRAIGERQVEKFSEGVGSFLAAFTNSVIYLLSQSTVVLLFLMFLLFGSQQEEELRGVLADIDLKIKNYIQVKFTLSLGTGLVVGTILHILGVDLAFVFGLMAVLLNFIPNVGSILATILPLPLILVDPSMSTTGAVLAIVLPGTIQFMIGNVVEPKLLGDSLNLSPVIILLSLTVWTALWGGIGALLAVPITAIIQILCEQLAFTRPVAAILKGDLLALMSAYKKPKPGEGEKAERKRDKSIPKDLQEVGMDHLYHDVRKVEKTFKEGSKTEDYSETMGS